MVIARFSRVWHLPFTEVSEKYSDAKVISNVVECQDQTTHKLLGEIVYLSEVLRAPISDRQCVLYKARVEEYLSSDWYKVISESKGIPFLVRLGSDHVFVRPSKARLLLDYDEHHNLMSGEQAPMKLVLYLTKHREKIQSNLRYGEGIFENGEEIGVVGQGKWINVDEIEELRHREIKGDRIFVFQVSPEEPLYLGDDITMKNFVRSTSAPTDGIQFIRTSEEQVGSTWGETVD